MMQPKQTDINSSANQNEPSQNQPKNELSKVDKQGIEIVHVVAISTNHCIGKDNDLPWHISADLKHFKALTQGGVMLLGRKNYDSFGGRPLPKRSHWIITRQKDWQAGFTNTEATRVNVAHSLAGALAGALAEVKARGQKQLWVIGGGTVYEATMPITDRLEITHVNTHIAGDVFYPAIPTAFQKTAENCQHDEKSGLDYCFTTYVAKTG